MTDKTINAALSDRLKSLGLPTAYENAPFTPVANTLYLKEDFIPRETVPVGMEFSSSNDRGGIYQVLVMAPRDKTKGDGYAKALQVMEQFPRGLKLVRDNLSIRIERSFQSGGYMSGDRWVIPVSVRYRAFDA